MCRPPDRLRDCPRIPKRPEAAPKWRRPRHSRAPQRAQSFASSRLHSRSHRPRLASTCAWEPCSPQGATPVREWREIPNLNQTHQRAHLADAQCADAPADAWEPVHMAAATHIPPCRPSHYPHPVAIHRILSPSRVFLCLTHFVWPPPRLCPPLQPSAALSPCSRALVRSTPRTQRRRSPPHRRHPLGQPRTRVGRSRPN